MFTMTKKKSPTPKQCKVCEYLFYLNQSVAASYIRPTQTKHYSNLAKLKFASIIDAPKLNTLFLCGTAHRDMAVAFRKNNRNMREQELNRLRAIVAAGAGKNKISFAQTKRRLRELEEKLAQ